MTNVTQFALFTTAPIIGARSDAWIWGCGAEEVGESRMI